ncbi:MAG: ABC transporter substrate-binding protein [Alphaproteobacteria bacterium]|nr:ABC transporter substrate-binding protein [Alphaproteobacteria bacterium]
MLLLRRLAVAAFFAAAMTGPIQAQEESLTIAYHSGPGNEAPDPRARQWGWLSNQMGVTETLMGLDHELQLYPRLAESIEQSGPTTWRVTLREGVTFHDGSPVTAQSVIDSLTPIAEEGHPAHNARLVDLLDLAETKTDGDRVVIFETNSPNAAFPWTLTEPGVVVLGQPSEAFPINATGPFIFREAVTDQWYRVEANPNYRDGAPALAEATIRKIPDPATAALAFEAGEVDLVINYAETDYERIQSTGAQGYAAPTTRLYHYALNHRSGPMTNVLIRRAVSLAIDRQAIVEAALSGVGGVAAGAIFPQVMKGWAADIAPVYDPAKAEQLLAEAGAVKEGGLWMLDGEPLTIRIVTYASRAANPPTAELTQAFLQAIGVTATVSIGEFGANNEAIANGTADMHLQAFGTAPQGDPSYFPELLLAGPAFRIGGNVGGYANPKLDALLTDGRQTFDEAERRDIYTRVQELIAEEAALIPVFHSNQTSIGRTGLSGFRVHPAETYWLDTEVSLSE